MSAHLVKGDDSVLRNEVLDALIAQLLGDQDRTLALEEIVIPSPATAVGGDDAGETTGSGSDARSAALAVAINASQTPPFMTDVIRGTRDLPSAVRRIRMRQASSANVRWLMASS